MDEITNLIHDFEQEISHLEKSFEIIKRKTNERKDIKHRVELKQIQLEDSFKENSAFLYSHYFKMISNQIKSVSELLYEQIRTFSSNQASNEYAAVKNSSTLLNNILFDFKIEDFFKATNRIQISISFKGILKENDMFSVNLKSKAFLFEHLYNTYIQIKQKSKEMQTMNSICQLGNSSEHLTDEYRTLLKQCVKNDKYNQNKYLNEILKRITLFNEKYNLEYFNQVNFLIFFISSF